LHHLVKLKRFDGENATQADFYGCLGVGLLLVKNLRSKWLRSLERGTQTAVADG